MTCWFESSHVHFASVAQRITASGYGPEDSRFESWRGHMGKKTVTLQFVFDEEEDDGYTYIKLTKIKPVSSDVDDETMYSYLVGLAQSDYMWIEFPNQVMDAMEGQTVDATQRY